MGVPAQQGSGRHRSQAAQLGGHQAAHRAAVRPIDPRQRWCGLVRRSTATSCRRTRISTLGYVGAGEECQPAQHADERQVGESGSHTERSCWPGFGLGCGRRPVKEALVRVRDMDLGTHTRLPGHGWSSVVQWRTGGAADDRLHVFASPDLGKVVGVSGKTIPPVFSYQSRRVTSSAALVVSRIYFSGVMTKHRETNRPRFLWQFGLTQAGETYSPWVSSV